MKPKQCLVVFASEARASLLRATLLRPFVSVETRKELVAETTKRPAIVFVDVERLYEIEDTFSPVIGIIDDAAGDPLAKTVRTLDAYPWLSHVITTSMLAKPLAAAHLNTLLERLACESPKRLLDVKGVGRVAMLTRASRREARLERMRQFFAKQGLTPRTISTINDVAEELVTNALYDAPTESGFFPRPVPRTEDVELPPDRACEISYGIEDGTAFVRVRDTFGALTRARLLNVLRRCTAAGTVELDESRGGAGLGMWRVFAAATTLAIAVVPGRVTDFLVGIATKDGRPVAKHLLAAHLFFAVPANGSLDSLIPDDEHDLIDHSVTLVHCA